MGLADGARWAPYLNHPGTLIAFALVVVAIVVMKALRVINRPRERAILLLLVAPPLLVLIGIAALKTWREVNPAQPAPGASQQSANTAQPNADPSLSLSMKSPANSLTTNVGPITVTGAQQSNVQVVNGNGAVVSNNMDNHHAQ
jgi:hypothetical protein